jgi:hypothetical protein
MIPKTYRDPESETLATFAFASLGGLLAAGAVGTPDLSLLLYPIYFGLVNGALAILIHHRRSVLAVGFDDERALHPDLAKRRSGEELGTTTKQHMVELTEGGEGKQDAADGRVDIEVHDVYKDMATATVHTATYHEYVHLVRTAEGWRIANALWQLTHSS